MLLKRLRQGKSRDGWKERWGGYTPSAMTSGPRMWVHAASVGEVSAAIPIISEVRARRPDVQCIVTVITPGGYEVAQGQQGKQVESVYYAPFDVPWSASRAMSAIKPDLLVIMETEIWPNMLHYARRAGARIVIANGRISDRSFPRYLSARGLFGWALAHFDKILTQTSTDSERFRAIGADASRVHTCGNTKFDQAVTLLSEPQRAELKRDLRIPDNAPVLVIGSTRSAEEERILIRAVRKVRESVSDLVLIHAPRHIDRSEELAGLMREAGLDPARKTELSPIKQTRDLILDTFGELSNIYGIADVAYIGNSLIAPGGGQNLLQPLAHGKPVIYGPYMQNFRDLEFMASSAGVGFRVDDEKGIAIALLSLLRDPHRREQIGEKARNLVESNRGSAARYAEEILRLLSFARERR